VTDNATRTRELEQSPTPGQTWGYYEGRADDPARDWPENPFGDRYVRFSAVINEVDADYVALTVTRRNRHVHAPEPGAEIATTTETLQTDPRYQLNRGGS
jgi:hypothetical protein